MWLLHERKNLGTVFKSGTIFEEEVVQKDVKSGARLTLQEEARIKSSAKGRGGVHWGSSWSSGWHNTAEKGALA